MFTNSLAIINQIKTDLTSALTVPNLTINLDEPLDLVYSDLPTLSIYPLKEDFVFSDSFTQDKKQLFIRIELRMVSGPASTICTPVINDISTAIKADRTLGNLADYVELQSIQWANDKTESGYVCGASLDLQVDYLI
jgi:hypothetical protein